MKLLLSVLTGFIFAISTQAASFDCNKAATEIEKMLCADKELSKLDETLAHSYKNALTTSLNKSDLEAEQKSWLKNIRDKCKDDARCLSAVYGTRISSLEKILPEPSQNSNAVASTIRYRAVRVGKTDLLFPKLIDFKDLSIMKSVNQQIDSLTKDFGCDEGGDFNVKSDVSYAANDVFSIYASLTYECAGTAYPTTDANNSLTFDLRTGKIIEFKDLFTNYTADKNEIIKIMFAEQIGSGEYGDDYFQQLTEEGLNNGFDFNISKKGLMVEPQFPHAAAALNVLVTVPYQKILKYAPPDGLLARVSK